MMNSIIWKGVSSTTISGLLISELPPISKPAMRVKETTIDGRDGSIMEELGYSSYDKNVVIGLHGNFDINKVIKYFTGEGEVVFSNEPDKVYTAKIVGQIDYTRLLRYRQATIPFRVQPFKRKLFEAYKPAQTATATGTNLVLKDSGSTPIKVATQAQKVIVHGKNIVNAHSFNLLTNETIDVRENGYTIIASGGASKQYARSQQELPIAMKGKAYSLVCDDIKCNPSSAVCGVQVVIRVGESEKYHGLYSKGGNIDFVVPEDATSLVIGIYTNNSNVVLTENNTVTVSGLRIVPTELKNGAWSPFDGLQNLSVVDGIVDGIGYEPVTVISNADNVAMTAEYFKNYEVFNEGFETSKPVMVLKGEGTVVVSVNGLEIFEYTFPEGENEVIIDSEKEDAYLGDVLKNRNMNGEFPDLLPGTNIISWSGSVSSIEILPRSRWL